MKSLSSVWTRRWERIGCLPEDRGLYPKLKVGEHLEGLDPAKITEYIKPAGLAMTKVTKRGTERDTGGESIFSYVLVLILYGTVLFYGQIILRGVIEEKSSRVVEIVLSSFRPFQLMAGKILGIAAVGFTQYAIWVLFGFFAFRFSTPLFHPHFDVSSHLHLDAAVYPNIGIHCSSDFDHNFDDLDFCQNLPGGNSHVRKTARFIRDYQMDAYRYG